MLHLSTWIDTTKGTKASRSACACLTLTRSNDAGHRKCYCSTLLFVFPYSKISYIPSEN